MTEMEDVRFCYVQKPFYETSYTFVSKEDICAQLIRSIQSSLNNSNHGRRRKLGEISSNTEFYTPAKKLVRAAPLKKVPQVVVKPEKKDLINTLPDELLVEVFRFISGPADRYSCASVCTRWLMLQSHIHMNELRGDSSKAINESDDLKRSLEGKRATDVRLALVSLRGSLGKLTIKGGPRQNPAKAVSDIGLSAVGISCSSLKFLSVWDCPSITDVGFASIGKGCPKLQVLNVLNCPGFGNAALQAIAAGCPQLSNLNLEGCNMVGNSGLEEVARSCKELSCLSLISCKSIWDSGIAAVVSSCKSLKAMKIENLSIKDEALVAVSKLGLSLQKLKLGRLEEVTSDGFLAFGRNSNMKQLKHLSVSACQGFTDDTLELIGKSSKELKQLLLLGVGSVSGSRIVELMNECNSLESIHLEKCGLVPSSGFISPKNNSLKVLNIINCTGVAPGFLSGFSGSSSLTEIDLTGFLPLTDEALIEFLSKTGSSLTSLNLSGCSMLTDKAFFAIGGFCGSLGVLTLEGCSRVTDEGVKYLAGSSMVLQDLNLAKTNVSDDGLQVLLSTKGSLLKTLSLSGCVHVSNRTLECIEEFCTKLEALNVKDCKQLSYEELEKFEALLWWCQLCC